MAFLSTMGWTSWVLCEKKCLTLTAINAAQSHMQQQSQNIDLDNPEFQNAWAMIQNTHRSVFLTGKAGTGKSTFLRYICAHTKKKHVILAPTGIAAVNAGGQTLHSFFKIPFKPLIPDDPDYSPRRMRETMRFPRTKVKLLRELELIVIDEISMVRCDIIDFIDKVLRVYSGNMREPFGGKQLLFVGDIFQLEPVVTRDMRQILNHWYKQFFFFNARVFSQLGLVPIELRKIYRQSDNQFVALLDRVRVNQATAADLAALNTRATRRDTVDAINDEHMIALTTPEYTFHGEITGTFPDGDLPTNRDLTLKQGAQVIFIRNDKEGRWVNGTIAKVSALTDSDIEVEMENGETHNLDPEQWENVQYTYDEKEKKVIETPIGTFKQYPVKPAWALTVHKSQGLTFGKVVIDFAGGAFTSGQTYVALSRCTSLEGITLLKPLSMRDIIVSSAVVAFSHQFNNQQVIDSAIEQEKARHLYLRAVHAFDHNEFGECIAALSQARLLHDVTLKPAVQRLAAVKLQRFNRQEKEIKNLAQVIDAQNKMLRKLALEFTAMGDQSLGMGSLAEEPSTSYGTSQPALDEIAMRSALANYNKAIDISPTCIPAYLGKARLLMIIDEPRKALATIEQALKIEPGNYDALVAMAQYHGSQKDVPNAIKAYKRAIKAKRTAALPHEALAAIYEALGLDDLADRHAAKAKVLRAKEHKKK